MSVLYSVFDVIFRFMLHCLVAVINLHHHFIPVYHAWRPYVGTLKIFLESVHIRLFSVLTYLKNRSSVPT